MSPEDLLGKAGCHTQRCLNANKMIHHHQMLELGSGFFVVHATACAWFIDVGVMCDTNALYVYKNSVL